MSDFILTISDDRIVTVHEKTPNGFIPTTFKDILASKKPGRYDMSMKLKRQVRSNQQNRYYWACLGMIATEVGYITADMEKEERAEIINALHDIFKERILGTTTIRSSKDRRRRIKVKSSTADLDTSEFAKYMDKIKELHPYLPDPDDSHLTDFIDQYYFS